MPKKILELKQFMQGTISSPSALDIPEEAPVYSSNIDAITEEGKLKGIRENLMVTDSDAYSAYIQIIPEDFTGLAPNPTWNETVNTVNIKIGEAILDTFTTDDANAADTIYTSCREICDLLEANFNITSATPISFTTSPNYEDEEGTESGVTQVDVTDGAITDTSETVQGDNTIETNAFIVGEIFEIVDPDGSTDLERVKILEFDIATDTHLMVIERGFDETLAVAHAADSLMRKYTDYNTARVVFNTSPIPLEITSTRDSSSETFVGLSDHVPLDLSPRNMILTSSKEENEPKSTTNVVLYDQDIENQAFEMKVIENFYEENQGLRQIIEGAEEGLWSLGENISSVSLQTGPNAVFVGTGNASSSDPLWFGKIQHKQFGHSVEGYHLLPSRLEAIDEGEAIFNIGNMHHPVFSASGDPAVVDRKTEGLLGISGSSRRVFNIKNWAASGTYATENTALMGSQTPSGDLGFIPGGFYSSEKVTKALADTNVGANYFPYMNTANWSVDDWTNVDSYIDSHLHNETFADDSNAYVRQSYCWITDKTARDKIFLYAFRYTDDRNVTQDMLSRNLGYFTLDHSITTTEDMNSALGTGAKVHRDPPTGAFISDLYEKNDKLYVLYTRLQGFTHGDEWLYCVDLSQLDSMTTTLLTGQGLIARPITPAYGSLKNFGNAYRGSPNKDFWMPEDICNFAGIGSRSKVGKDGLYSVYSNYYKWRNCDCLGFNNNGSHTIFQTTVDGVTKAADTGAGWHTVYCEDDADQDENIHGYMADNNTYDYNDGNPYINDGDQTGTDFGYTYGFKKDSYRVYPHKKGLTNYRDSVDDIGVLCFLEGQQLSSKVKTHIGYKRLTQGIKKWHKYNWYYNDQNPTFTDWNDHVIMSANPENYGALQHTFAHGGQTLRGWTDLYDGLYPYTVIEKKNNSYFDGTYEGGWPSWTSQNASETGITIDGRIKQPKQAFRLGSIWNKNDSANTAGDSEEVTDHIRASHRVITKLAGGSASQSGQEGNDLNTENPPDKYGVISISKGELFATSTGSGQITKTTDNLFVTSTRSVESQNNTLINQWLKVVDDGTANPIADAYSPEDDYSPLRINELGNGSLTSSKDGVTGDKYITLYPTSGQIKNGFAYYNNAGVAQTSTGNGLYENVYSPYLFMYPGSELSVGLDIIFSTQVDTGEDTNDDGTVDVWDNGNFQAGQTYYWKVSLLYDGYQEGPLSNAHFEKTVTTDFNYNTALITLTLSDPPPRVSHIVLYRRNSTEEFYRMVTEVNLEEEWNYDDVADDYARIVTDAGILGATYEAVTGLPESIQHTIVNYKISTVALGHLIVGNCWHPEIKQGQNFLFKSEPNAFSSFNWARNYCILPNKPTAIAWFAGKLFAFDLHNMWRINLDTMVIEDAFEGIGCLDQESILVTDIGMFFCDNQGMYWHNGQKAENIGRDILQNSAAQDYSVGATSSDEDMEFQWAPWQKIHHSEPPRVLYDAKEQSVLFLFKNESPEWNETKYGAWKFSTTRKRWDLIDMNANKSILTGNKNDIYIGSELEGLVEIGGNYLDGKEYQFVSKWFNMGSATEEKNLSSIKMVFNTYQDAAAFIVAYADEDLVTLELDIQGEYYNKTGSDRVLNFKQDTSTSNVVICKIKKGTKRFRKLRLNIQKSKYEIDAISIIYRSKNVK